VTRLPPVAVTCGCSERVEQLERQVAALQRVVEALERRSPRPSQADAELLRTIAEETGGRIFSAGELLAHAHESPQLADGLARQLLEDPRGVGCWLRRMVDASIDGVRLMRERRSGTGRGWRAVLVNRDDCVDPHTHDGAA
jgi:hypothetical protein